MKAYPVTVMQMVLNDEPLYPDVVVDLGDLTGPEGNAWSIMGRVGEALKKNVSEDAAHIYSVKARSGTYEDILTLTGETVVAIISNIPEQYQHLFD